MNYKIQATSAVQTQHIDDYTTILCGIVPVAYCMIGAESVVTKSIPPFTLRYGNPAVHRGYVTKQGHVLGLDLKDKEIGKQYILINGKPEQHDKIFRPTSNQSSV
jgi:acyl-[acyl carrier protein]--UDP-N-acetylglucosamine O-acyltransferase